MASDAHLFNAAGKFQFFVRADEAATTDPEDIMPSLEELGDDAGSSALWDGASPRTAQVLGYKQIINKIHKTASALEEELEKKDREITLCSVCDAETADHVLIPCGHTA